MSKETRDGGGKRYGQLLPWLGTLLFVAALLFLVYLALGGSDLTDARDDLALWLFVLAGGICLAVLWQRQAAAQRAEEEIEERRDEAGVREEELSEVRERERQERARAEKAVRERDSLRSEQESVKRELGRERYLRSRSEEAHRSVERWRSQLHSEMMRLYGERGLLDEGAEDIPTMVLRLVMELVGARKGIILSRGGSDEEWLGLLAHEGFENDPTKSELVRGFAGEVLERDRALRENHPRSGGDAVEAEIENMVAIPIYLRERFDGVVVCANNPDGFDDYDDEVLLAVGDHAGAVLQNSRLQSDLKNSYLTTVGVLAEAMAVKEPSLRGHSDDVADYVLAMADHFELSAQRRETLIFGSLLHDVGKIGISEAILLKPAALSAEERTIVELHPRIGYHLVRRVPALRATAPAILHHHERYDGKGYPSGLRGEEIPLESRIISVADSFSAMITDRPYRTGCSIEEALEELRRCAGTQFDPEVVAAFVEIVRQNPPTRDEDSMVAGDPVLSKQLAGGEPVFGHALLSVTDNLTTLYTRRHLYETADAQVRRAAMHGKPFSVAFVRLDGVAKVNDRLGYAAGDRELLSAAKVVRRAAARRAGVACRYGDIRMAVVLPDSAGLDAAAFLKDLSEETNDPEATYSAATWMPGDDGVAVIERAASGLPGTATLDARRGAPG
ncbi:HD domain-containing phosphohydrolase [Rubrobacter indicoceani]|uniref:HD domain-containing phosphohydrolase n=1 Tax=Rubrobacter indicoceani TaxID=2051957 RepID=UPI000E5AAF25|nr:HD domain-containing phosphohydrolase [Rubrobacter indicoceani]